MINGSRKWPFWLMISLSLIVFFCLIREILLPFVLGMFIAYFLHPVIDRLERAGAARSVATLMILAGFFIIVALLSVLVIPTIFGQLSELIAALPGYVNDYQQKYAPQLSHWLGGLPAAATDDIKSAVANFSGVMVKFFGAFLDGILHSGIAFVHLLMLILITPIVAFYLLRDWKGMVTRIDNLLPREHMNVIHQQLAIIDRTLAGFVRGQLNVCLIMATYYAIGLSVVGLKFGIVIGLMTGLLVIFPYIGLMLGIAVGLGVAFFQFGDLTPMLTVLAVFLVGGSMEGYIITPKLVGSKVSLHPVWIIFGMLSGATLFGLVGILLAVPITAVIGVLIRFGTDRYLQSDYYRGTALHTAKK